MKYVITLMCCVLLSGCTEFAGGFGAGAAAVSKIAEDSQKRFVEAVNELNDETARLNAGREAVESIDIETFINPETIDAVNSLKGREKDPVTWVALASILANMFWGGKTYGAKKKTGGVL